MTGDVAVTIEPFDPSPPSSRGVLDAAQSRSNALMSIVIENKFVFMDEKGAIVHQYRLPPNVDVYYCGANVGKIVYYRDPALAAHLRIEGISKAAFANPAFPILATQSPQLDLLLFELIQRLRMRGVDRVKMLDLGCSVAEHYDLLDTMIKVASSGNSDASSVLSYCGVDHSGLLLAVARLLHHSVDPQHFELIQSEGSAVTLNEDEFDIAVSVGVVNQLADPMLGLEKLIRATKRACVVSVWVTPSDEGEWAIEHTGNNFYLFSKADLLRLQSVRPNGRFYVADFLPTLSSTQPRSFVGLGLEKLTGLGSYHLIYSDHAELGLGLEPLIPS